MLSGPVKRLVAVPSPAAEAVAVASKLSAKEEKVQKRKVERKRMLLFVGVFFVLAMAYFNDDNATIREHTKIQSADVDDEPTQRDKKEGGIKNDKSELKVKGMTKKINDYKMALGKLQNERSQLEEHIKTSKNLSAQALIEENAKVGDLAQRKDADIFYRNGVRELQNKNYRRAFTAFETALTVDPQHELAKIYLKSAKMELLSELWSTQVAGLRAKASLRYKESRMHFENIVRYMDNESGGTSSMEGEENKELKELYDDAKKELTDLDTLESKGK
jgi:tetratricopeptide (TPR) repeat protein